MFWLRNALRATAACYFSPSAVQKVVRSREFFHILTCKCASRHSSVLFLTIGTSKMAPTMRCFVHFDLQMCFAPQRRAIFEHQNVQNWSAIVVFCAFWLANVLRAAAACNFWTLFEHQNIQNWSAIVVFCAFWLENVLRATTAIFHLSARTATSAPAALPRLLFEHQEPRIIEKTQRFAPSLTFFAHVPSFWWLYTRVDLLSAAWTSLLCLTPLLCFSTLHIVGS